MCPLHFICNQKCIVIFTLFCLEHADNDWRQDYQVNL